MYSIEINKQNILAQHFVRKALVGDFFGIHRIPGKFSISVYDCIY